LWLPDYAMGRHRGRLLCVRHLRGCAECQQTLQQLLAAAHAPQELASEPLPPVELLLDRIDEQEQEGRKADVVRSTRRVRRWALVRPVWQYLALISAAFAALAHLRRRR
jgi:hypothetical protein